MDNNGLSVNPMEIIQMIKSGKNPQQIVLSVFESNLGNINPIAANLVSLAKSNRSAEIEKVARNICKERGVDFDKEFNDFKSNLFKAMKP